MSEAEIRRELASILASADFDDDEASRHVERIMDMVAEYVREYASDVAADTLRDYEERM